MPAVAPLGVALIQHPPVFLNLRASIDLALDLIEAAARDGARLVVFPETWLPGYPLWLDHAPGAALWAHPPARALFRRLVDQSPSLAGDDLGALVAVAARLGVDVVMGLNERAGGTLYNATALFGADGVVRSRRKLTPTYNEKLVWGQGDGSTLGVWRRPWGDLGSLICWEHWMPLARAAMHAQSEAVHVAQWPAVGELHQLASRHYAFEGQCVVLAAGAAMTRAAMLDGYDTLPDAGGRAMLETIPADAEWLMAGGGAIIAPTADYLVAPAYRDARTVHAELDLAALRSARLELDVAGHYARPDVFELRVDARTRRDVIFDDASAEDRADL